MIKEEESLKKSRLILEAALSSVCERASGHFKGLPLIRWRISKDLTVVNLLDTKRPGGGAEADPLMTIRIKDGLYSLNPRENEQELLNMLVQEVRRLNAAEGISSYVVDSVRILSLPQGDRFAPESNPTKIIENMNQNLPVDNLINVATRRMMDLKILGEDTISLRGKDQSGNNVWEIYDNALPMLNQIPPLEDEEMEMQNPQNLRVALNNTKGSKPMLAIRRAGSELHMYANTESGKILLAFMDHAILEDCLGSARRELNG